MRNVRDAALVSLSMVHALAIWQLPSIPVIAILLWWNSNTISHNFIHRPFFRSNAMNRTYSIFLTLLLGFPQSLWRERHLMHHRGKGQVRVNAVIVAEAAAVFALWTALLTQAPRFFLTTYLPAYAAGLLLCFVHGYFEHWRIAASHYGFAYNMVFFNDGYHVEHHLRPAEHWSRLPKLTQQAARTSRWPAVLRWIEAIDLETLERVTTRSAIIRRLLLNSHERALRRLLPNAGEIQSIKIVGGGLFPRTAMLLRKLLPRASIVIVDKSVENLEAARGFLTGDVTLQKGFFEVGVPEGEDLLVIPLALTGDRKSIYANPPARVVLVHDWIWRKRGESAVVAWWLLKRINLVMR